ncbi:MAG: hypothetical protein AAF664_15135, partial [Planctomycetota bacterium]
MDQVKEYGAVLLKHWFWICSSLVLLVGSFFWYSTTTTLDEEYESAKSSINGSFSTVSGVRSELSTHPNAISHKKMQALIDERKMEVFRSWQQLYQRQQDYLVWPVKALGENFVSRYQGKVPIEAHFPHPLPDKDRIPSALRQIYPKYIEETLPAIALVGGTEWTVGVEQENTVEDNVNSVFDDGPLVQWSEESQSNTLKDLFPWKSTGTPSTLEIYYSQENLWILRQLMAIVSNVNGDVKQRYQAKIRSITSLNIGSSVDFASGEILAVGESARAFGSIGGGGPEGMMDGGMEAELAAEMAAMSGGMGGGMGGTTTRSTTRTLSTLAAGPDPADNRYVDIGLESIQGSSLRAALTTPQPAANQIPIAIAKRVPIKMVLQMHQKAVPELIAACGSAKLMVHVEQVRLLPKDESKSGGAASMNGGMGMDAMMEMEMEMMDSRDAMMSAGPTAQQKKRERPVDEFPLDVSAEIYGVINIYNPADPEKLYIESINEDTVEDAVANLGGNAEAAATPQAEPPSATGTGEVLPGPSDQPADATDDGASPADTPEAPTPPVDAQAAANTVSEPRLAN